jgi:asparagine synthase (glutamine-hydrolysing)
VLVSWPAHYGEQTIERDLHRLPPAHALSLSDGRSHLTKYWRLEDTPALRLRRSEEYVEGFLSIYDRAVRDRLRSTGKIGISLSGGLDSGSTAALAARALRERGGRLLAYTSIPARAVAYAESKRTLGDEWRLAQATATTAGNVDLIAVDARDVTPIQGVLRTLRIHAEPGHAASNHFWIRKLLDTAAQDGVKTLLTGQGGNATVSWSGANRTRMALRLLKRRSWKRALQLLIYPLLPVPLLRGARHLLHRGGLDWSGTSISPDFAARIHLSAEYIQNTGNVTNGEEWHAPIHQRWSTIRPGASFIGSIWAESGAAHGLDVLDATFDKRVMEFALSIPDREYAPADSQDRWVIRSAMQGLLPDEVRLNRRQGLQAADLGWRLIDSASEVEQALASIESSQLARQYLSVDRMRLVWDSVQQEITPWAAHSAITILMRGIMAGLHLVDRERMD